MLRLTVASVGGLGPVPLDLGSRTDIPSAAGHAAARAPPHSAWRGPPRVWGKETSASFRPDLRRTACGELVPRAGGQKRSKKEIFVFAEKSEVTRLWFQETLGTKTVPLLYQQSYLVSENKTALLTSYQCLYIT